MVGIHSLLIDNQISIPEIVCTEDKQKFAELDNNNYMVIYSFIEGEQIGWSSKYCKLEKSIIKEIANILKKIHTVTYNENTFKVPNVPYIDKNTELHKSLLHFDLTKNNIFINENNIGIIDFDDAKFGPSICDISILIANLFFSKTYGVDLEGVNTFIEEYYHDEPDRKEKEVPLIKEYAIKWIDYILNGNEFDTSTTESFITKRELISNNL